MGAEGGGRRRETMVKITGTRVTEGKYGSAIFSRPIYI